MIVKKILERAPSYWEILWDAASTLRKKGMLVSTPSAPPDMLEDLLDKAGVDVPKKYRGYYIGHPYDHFDKASHTCCVRCADCWEKEWQGESMHD